MSRKISMSLAPLLAIAAFVIVPTAAQAVVGHWFANGVKLVESEGVSTQNGVADVGNLEEEGVGLGIAWGTLELKGETGAAAGGTIFCHNVAAGVNYNPIGAGAGKGNTETFAVFNCGGNVCKPGEATNVAPVSLPWPTEITGTTVATMRSQAGLTAAFPTSPVRVLVTCNGVATAPFEGKNQPLGPDGGTLRKGTSAKAPSETEFDTGSGELNLVNGFGGPTLGSSKTIGQLKNLGYTSQELIQIDPKGIG